MPCKNYRATLSPKMLRQRCAKYITRVSLLIVELRVSHFSLLLGLSQYELLHFWQIPVAPDFRYDPLPRSGLIFRSFGTFFSNALPPDVRAGCLGLLGGGAGFFAMSAAAPC